MSDRVREAYRRYAWLDETQRVSASYLARNTSSCLDRADRLPLFVSRGSQDVAVIVSAEDYRKLSKALVCLEEQKVRNEFIRIKYNLSPDIEFGDLARILQEERLGEGK